MFESLFSSLLLKVCLLFQQTPKTNSSINSLVGPPPPAPLNKVKLTKGSVEGPLVKKDKRHSISRFNISKNMELEVLPLLKGTARTLVKHIFFVNIPMFK